MQQCRSGFFRFDAIAHVWCEVAANSWCIVTDDKPQRLNHVGQPLKLTSPSQSTAAENLKHPYLPRERENTSAQD